jgi:hypothetical protein
MDNNSNNNIELIKALQSQITFLQQTVTELTRRVNNLERNRTKPPIYPEPCFPFGPKINFTE